jgi:hypothetical protein
MRGGQIRHACLPLGEVDLSRKYCPFYRKEKLLIFFSILASTSRNESVPA